jgi:hypothetical protein
MSEFFLVVFNIKTVVMDIAREKMCPSDFIDEKAESKKIRRDDAILFNDICPGMKVEVIFIC